MSKNKMKIQSLKRVHNVVSDSSSCYDESVCIAECKIIIFKNISENLANVPGNLIPPRKEPYGNDLISQLIKDYTV